MAGGRMKRNTDMRKKAHIRKKAYISGWIAGIGAGALLSNIIVFFTVFRNPEKKWKKDRYDCAVVCGWPAKEDGQASEIMKARVKKAADLWREGKVSTLILSGAAVKNEHTEAQVMKEYAKSLGVPEERICTEEKSFSTYHNMMYSKQVMERRGEKDCVVVTSGWHLRKADHYARRFGMDYVMCAADEPEGGKITDTIFRYLSTNLAMYRNFYRGLY